MDRPRAEGKFLFLGDEKFFVRGATYGAFAPNTLGHQFPEHDDVEHDFALMAQAGINSILTYTVPPVSMLDQAARHGLRVIVNIPWQAYVCFLEEESTRRKVREEVRQAVRSCRQHEAVLMHCVAKELPPQIVRWHGAEKMESFLRELYDVAKQEDPTSLVTYTNFPTTEYLDLSFVDVYTFNVYLHHKSEFCPYLSRLQHLSGEKPLVLTELGMCSFRHGREGQAEFLRWQLREAFDQGTAGAIVFGWTDPFFQDGLLIDDWGFGLVDAERRPKPSYDTVKKIFSRESPFPPEKTWPRVSVVVALHNAERTLVNCLEALNRLNYPNYEVICVNDGSTDSSQDIINRYPFRCIQGEQQGVSAARNAGMRAAEGEIVAYIDSDADADPDWLNYLVTTFQKQNVAAVGGPNFVPKEDEWVAKCVYRSPGGPTQVMFDDNYAEHIPGCNMAFRKWALEEIDGFDPLFRTAGDDVDLCWRLLERGHNIGFSPSAVVWHHRRPSTRAYWRQQVGYGMSEALLEKKHPNKFNPWGHTFWAGNIYGPYPVFRLMAKPVIYQGMWGSAGFQPMYDAGGTGPLSFLPRAMEWHVALAALTVIGLFFPWTLGVVAAGILYTLYYACVCGGKANLDVLIATEGRPSFLTKLKWQATIAWLHLLEPVARDWGRLRGGLTPWRSGLLAARPSGLLSPWWQRLQPFGRSLQWVRSGGMHLDKFPMLDQLLRTLTARHCAVGWNPQHEGWDLKVRRGALGQALLKVVIEHHGGPKRVARLSAKIHPSRTIYWFQAGLVLLGVLTAALGSTPAFATVATLFALLWVAPIVEANRLERAIHAAAEDTAVELDGEDGTRVWDSLPVRSEHDQPTQQAAARVASAAAGR